MVLSLFSVLPLEALQVKLSTRSYSKHCKQALCYSACLCTVAERPRVETDMS